MEFMNNFVEREWRNMVNLKNYILCRLGLRASVLGCAGFSNCFGSGFGSEAQNMVGVWVGDNCEKKSFGSGVRVTSSIDFKKNLNF